MEMKDNGDMGRLSIRLGHAVVGNGNGTQGYRLDTEWDCVVHTQRTGKEDGHERNIRGTTLADSLSD